jgi:C_GCAxxG_C_C family probable redox protein
MDPAAFARDRFLSHWNCTQAVLEGLGPESGLSAETITRITTPFAAGMWSGLTCGAVTGAMMAIGMRFGRSSDGDAAATEATTAKVRELVTTLGKEFGGLDCSALLGVDMATDAGIKEAASKGLFKSKCPLLVEASVREAARLMA